MAQLTRSGRGSDKRTEWRRVGVEPGSAGEAAPRGSLAPVDPVSRTLDQESLELYREVLFSISDAVMVADEDGRLVWACPNVSHSFGCSAESLMTLGTVEAVFGRGLFAPEALRERGELANIETSIRDATGRERILLVSVKEVHIGRGRVLYSCRDITDCRLAEEALRVANAQLDRDRENLRCKNAALQEVLSRMGSERRRIVKAMQANMDRAVMPLIEDLRTGLDAARQPAADLLVQTLARITSPFLQTLEARFPQLTAREVTICNLIRNGFSTKEIARSLHTSEETVRTQRKGIRRKLGVRGRSDSLSTLLRAAFHADSPGVDAAGCRTVLSDDTLLEG